MPEQAAQASQAAQDGHIMALDGLRGLAVLLVFLCHCSCFGQASSANSPMLASFVQLMYLGFCGVDLFFVLSGYLITSILLRAKGQRHYLRNFYVRRALRIFPLYYATLAVCEILALILRSQRSSIVGDTRYHASLWAYGTNFVQSFATTVPDSGWGFGHLDHLWSLAVEEHFYLLWPLLVLVLGRRSLTTTCGAIAVASLILRIGFCYLGHHETAAYVFTPCRLDGLAIGAFIALRFAQGDFQTIEKAARTVFVVSLFCLPFYAAAQVSDVTTRVIVGPTLFGLLFGGALVLVLRQGFLRTPLEHWTLRLLGRYSYAVYLFHLIIIGLLALRCPRSGNGLIDLALFTTAAGLLTLSAGVLSYHFFEIQFLKLKRRFN